MNYRQVRELFERTTREVLRCISTEAVRQQGPEAAFTHEGSIRGSYSGIVGSAALCNEMAPANTLRIAIKPALEDTNDSLTEEDIEKIISEMEKVFDGDSPGELPALTSMLEKAGISWPELFDELPKYLNAIGNEERAEKTDPLDW